MCIYRVLIPSLMIESLLITMHPGIICFGTCIPSRFCP